MQMNYYFDDNGYFIREGIANPGSQPPRNATRQCIPDCPAGYIPKWVDGAWTLEETNHGKQAWNTDTAMPVTIKQHGPIPAGLTLLAPPEYPVWNPATNEWDTDLVAKEQARRQAILEELESLDKAAVRPLRAVAAGTATPEDTDMIAQIEANALALRDELAGLEAS